MPSPMITAALARPTARPSPTATAIPVNSRESLPFRGPQDQYALNVMTYGTERSIPPPPPVMTSIWPSATNARKDAAVALIVSEPNENRWVTTPMRIQAKMDPSTAHAHGARFRSDPRAAHMSLIQLEAFMMTAPSWPGRARQARGSESGPPQRM